VPSTGAVPDLAVKETVIVVVSRAVTLPTKPVTVEPFAYTEAKSPTATPSDEGLPLATVKTPVAATQLPEA